MLVWVLIITLTGPLNQHSSGLQFQSGAAVTIIDNIESAISCEQLARVIRSQPEVRSAVCAPVRKIRP